MDQKELIKRKLVELKLEEQADELATKLVEDGWNSEVLNQITDETLKDLGFKRGWIASFRVGYPAPQQQDPKTKDSSNNNNNDNLIVEMAKRLREMELKLEDQFWTSLSAFESLSHISVFNRVAERAPWVINEGEVLTTLEDVGLDFTTLVWNACQKHLIPLANIPEPSLQAVVEKVINEIHTHTRTRRGSPSTLQISYRKQLSDPDKLPDILISPATESIVSWRNLLIAGELESPSKPDRVKEGVGQAVSYLSSALIKQRRKWGIAFYSDGSEIIFIKMRPGEQEPFLWTPAYPFLASHDGSVPRGFSIMVQLLVATTEQLGYSILHPTQIDLNGNQVPVLTCLGIGSTSCVYHCKLDGQDVAVKVQRRDCSRATIAEEHELLLKLSVHIKSIPQPQLLTRDKKLVLTPVGIPLLQAMADPTWTWANTYGVIKQLLTLLEEVHHHGIAHADIRPSNIINANNTALLIDWGCSVPLGQKLLTLVGTPTFASSRMLKQLAKKNTFQYFAADDVESLAYTLFAMVHPNRSLPWKKAETSGAILTLREKLLQAPTTPAELFYHKIMTLENRQNVPYEELRAMLP